MNYPLATILMWATTGRIAFKIFDYIDVKFRFGPPMFMEWVVLCICLYYINK
jgi:hypothetical protein